MTHAAMLSGNYTNFIVNDIGDAPKLFQAAINGEYANETRWISREDFKRLKDTDAYVRLCWSFSNNQVNYLYSREVELWKKALHWARVYGDTSFLREMGIESDGSRLDIKKHKDEYKEKYIRYWLSLQEYSAAELDELIKSTKDDIAKDEEELRNYLLEALKASGLTQAEVQRRLGTQMSGHYFGRSQWAFPTEEYYRQMQTFMPLPTDYNELVGLYHLRQSLQRLQSLESLESLESLQGDYQSVPIPDNALVYCDPPYRGTDCSGYDGFDFERFDKWLADVPFMVVISEYTCPDDCVEVARCDKILKQVSKQKNVKQEKLFVQKRFENEYYKQMGRLW